VKGIETMASQIFSIVNPIAIVGWVLLAAFPRRRWAELAGGRVVPALLSAVYVAIIVAAWGRSPGGFSSLAAVSQLFQSPWLLLAGWVHYLAFDLLVGSWIVRDAHERGIAHGWVVPLLLLTFLFGPAGWLSYLGLRGAMRARTARATALQFPSHVAR
jgi:ABA4-like protein